MKKTYKKLSTDFQVPETDPSPVLEDATLYFGDNGRCFHGKCAGVSARFTGYDRSGKKVQKVTRADLDWAACERCH